MDQQAEHNKPHRREYESVIAEWNSVLAWSVDHGDDRTAAIARQKLQDLTDRLASRLPPPLGWADRFFAGPAPLNSTEVELTAALSKTDNDIWQADPEAVEQHVDRVTGPMPMDVSLWRDRLNAQDKRLIQGAPDLTLAAQVENYLVGKRVEVSAGELSAGRADNLRRHLQLALDFMGGSSSVEQIDSHTLSSFRTHLLERIAAKQLSRDYARDVLASFKTWVRWLAEHGRLDHLPTNIQSQSLRITSSLTAVVPLNNSQIEKLFKAATERMRLYMLLALNCGLTQIDMADLTPSEVDWKRGTITRKRSKTSDCENVPVVCYRLWPQTLEMLKKHRSNDRHRVLLTQTGRPVKTESISDTGKLRKSDPVGLAARRLAKKTGIVFTLKILKKTSATRLRNHRHYSGLERLFLGQAPRTLSDRNYTAVPQDLLDKGIAWLAKNLAIAQLQLD
ncbi:MAG: tyrosine-type recombinase/integrase [Pirellulales bacterium]